MLDERLPDFIKRAKEAKIPYVFLTTNGTLLDKLGCELLECSLDSMNISTDGHSSEMYEKIRGFPLEKVEEGVIKCAKYTRELNTKEHNISFNINCVLVYNEMRNDEFKATFAHKWRKWRDIITHINFISCINKNNKGESILPVINPTNSVCRLPFTRMMINSYGAVGFCCTMLGTQHYYPVKLPNIHDDSLENIWTKEFATHLRNEVLSDNYTRFNICKTCFERESSVLELNGESKQNNVDIY